MDIYSVDIVTLSDTSLLILDDDAVFRTRLGKALEQRGFRPTLAATLSEAFAIIEAAPPAFAVLDLRLDDGSGLTLVQALREARPE